MKNEYALLVGALAFAVAGKPLEIPETVDWRVLLRLARFHKVEALVYQGLRGVPIPEYAEKFLSGAFQNAIFRDTQMEYRKSVLETALKEANLPHVFLKGAVLKYSYPIPALRTMCDIDLLVRTEDYAALDAVMQSVGGEVVYSDGNHRNYHFPDGVKLECHPNLVHHAVPVGTGINPGWQYADGNTLSPEGVYLNTLCHLADHFVSGGVGARFLLDVWVNRYLRKPPMDRTFVESELERIGLLEFACKIEDLADVWFGNGPMTPLLEELGEYILTSGSYGTTDRAILNAVSLSPGRNRMSALLKKAFYPKADLEDRFPWCKGKTWLLPVAWCCRAFKAVTTNGKIIIKWSKDSGKIDKAQANENMRKLNRFGIYSNRKDRE